jgi:hypothetical protein
VSDQYTRADSLREYLTGATSDGGAQASPAASLGGYRSSTEALSLGILITGILPGTAVQYAGGANPIGAGILTALDTNHLAWQPAGATQQGPPAFFVSTGDVKVVEAYGAPGQYLRVQGTLPFTPGACGVVLSYLVDNFFGFDDVTITQAAGGFSEYRATVVRNQSTSAIGNFQRWVALLGTPQTPNVGSLPASGAGILSTNGTFIDWPTTGWCRIATSSGSLREIVYYNARTNTALTVPAAGRALLGSSSSAGAATDVISPVPGVALGVDPTGVIPFGTAIQTIANANTPPTGVTWATGITPATGAQIGAMAVNYQVGIWAWRQMPAGAVSTPQAVTLFNDNFNAF